uniref:Uncharacterized protein n=1 Tax=Anguilla anguilla TaxID=7936 RepID=A0A0E9QEP5_ANGAN
MGGRSTLQDLDLLTHGLICTQS